MILFTWRIIPGLVSGQYHPLFIYSINHKKVILDTITSFLKKKTLTCLRLQSDKFELVSTDGATTIFIQDVEKSWFRSLMQKFSMRGKKTAAGERKGDIYVYMVIYTPWNKHSSLKSSLPTTISEQQTILGAILTCDPSQMFLPYSIYGLKSLLKSATSETKTTLKRRPFEK